MNQLEQGREETLTAAGRDAARQSSKVTLTAAEVTEGFRQRDRREQQLQTTQEERETPDQIAGAGQQSIFHRRKNETNKNASVCTRRPRRYRPGLVTASCGVRRSTIAVQSRSDLRSVILNLLLRAKIRSCGATPTLRFGFFGEYSNLKYYLILHRKYT